MSELTNLQKRIEKEIENKGIVMSKQISSGGLFRGDVYDTRTARSFKEVIRLNRKGFYAEADLGTIVFNAIMSDVNEEESDE